MKISIAKNELDFSQKESLNKNFWKNEKLNKEVKAAILAIVKDFLKSTNLELSVDEVDEIEFTGSLANYNYSDFSDVDVHLLFDFSKLGKDPDFLRDYLTTKAINWNNRRNVTIYGYEVELYITDAGSDHHSTGVYSVKNDKWLVKPVRDPKLSAELNLNKVKDKADKISKEIDMLVVKQDDVSAEKIENLKDKIKKMREAGLEERGEYSTENLAFKLLRRRGELNTIYSLMNQAADAELSLDEDDNREWWQKRRKKDNKNYLELIGHVRGAKKNKKGVPYMLEPTKKLPMSGPPGVGSLEEQTESKTSDFATAIKELKNGNKVLMLLKGKKLNNVTPCLKAHEYAITQPKNLVKDNKFIFSFNGDEKTIKNITTKDIKKLINPYLTTSVNVKDDCILFNGEKVTLSFLELKEIVSNERRNNNLTGFNIIKSTKQVKIKQTKPKQPELSKDIPSPEKEVDPKQDTSTTSLITNAFTFPQKDVTEINFFEKTTPRLREQLFKLAFAAKKIFGDTARLAITEAEASEGHVGGSQHITGNAADFYISGISGSLLDRYKKAYCLTLAAMAAGVIEKGGLGIYFKSDGVTLSDKPHYDTRGYNSAWKWIGGKQSKATRKSKTAIIEKNLLKLPVEFIRLAKQYRNKLG